jgi:HTH-type transcriptional regulator, transcriptional repressor of NAD biosynthesis genes
MIRGLVIGKFLPIHNGHLALIEFAAQHCDEVIVSMSFTDRDVIDSHLRFSWIQTIFKDRESIKPTMIPDDFDDLSLPWHERTQRWADVISKVYPKIDALFSSEEYGEPFARHLGATHYAFDPDRISLPVSATLIRNSPFKYWSFIPRIVQPYFVKKICFFGPESTGKTWMAKRMAEKFNTVFVPEVAREMLITNDFSIDDIERIGVAHHERVLSKTQEANRLLMCDTDAITTAIYSHHYLSEVPSVIGELEKKTTYDHYFLFDIDVPWVADGLRDLGDKRSEMFEIFRNALLERKIPYTLVQGTYEEREALCEQTIRDKFL